MDVAALIVVPGGVVGPTCRMVPLRPLVPHALKRTAACSLACLLGCALLVGATGAASASCPTPSQLCAATPGANLLANPCSCTTFFQCSGAVGYLLTCSAGLFFNPARSYCDWPVNVPQVGTAVCGLAFWARHQVAAWRLVCWRCVPGAPAPAPPARPATPHT